MVVLSEGVSDAHLAGLRGEGVSYVFAGKSELDLALALDILNREFDVKRLLLEGGGGANGAFLRAGLVDELNLILCPSVDGAKGLRASSTPRMLRPIAGPPLWRCRLRAAGPWKAAQCSCVTGSSMRIPRWSAGSAPAWPDNIQTVVVGLTPQPDGRPCTRRAGKK